MFGLFKKSQAKQHDKNKSLHDYNNNEYIHGALINEIIAKSDNTLLFLHWKDKSYKIIDITPDTSDIVNYIEKSNYLSRLSSQIEFEGFNKKDNYNLNAELASAYYTAITDKSNDNISGIFENVEKLIKQSIEDSQESKHITFIVCNITHSFFFIGLIYFFLLEYHPSVIAILGGILGSMLSVIQRNKETKQVHFKNRKNIILFSFISIILGATSGFVLYWASKANILLSDVHKVPSALFVFAIFAGTSERYLNSFLKKSESIVEE